MCVRCPCAERASSPPCWLRIVDELAQAVRLATEHRSSSVGNKRWTDRSAAAAVAPIALMRLRSLAYSAHMDRMPSGGPALPTWSQRRYGGEYGAHAHAHAQVLIGRAGMLELEVNGHAHFVDATCGLVVPAGASHAFHAQAPAQLMVLDTPPHRGLDRCVRFLLPPRWREAACTIDAADVLDALATAPRLLQRRAIRLDTIDAAIDAELHGDWTTARLAALANLSAQRFHARFVALTGTTPGEHVRRKRLAAAQQRLLDGWPLETTALHVGYASASALAYALRRDCQLGARALRRAG